MLSIQYVTLYLCFSCWVSGYGKTSPYGDTASALKEVQLPVLDGNTCQNRLRSSALGPYFIFDRNSFICAGGMRGRDACNVKYKL